MPASLDEVFSLFEARTNLEKGVSGKMREYRLDRMRELCAFFGNPQDACGVIHLAGSKGKGSTAAYIAALLEAGGARVGVYSSPHLRDYRERFTLMGEKFPERAALETAHELLQGLPEAEKCLSGRSPATTFELLTLFGFMLFRRLECQFTVLECGLGGRLDATNVVSRPLAVLITPVEMEHAEILGSRLTDIAGEKAGIFKPGVPVWCARQSPAVMKVLRRRAKAMGAAFYGLGDSLRRVCGCTSGVFHWRLEWRDAPPEIIMLGMGGKFQALNAALAIAAMRGIIPASSNIDLGLLADVRLPGRFQIFRRSPLMVLDGAHTPRSVGGTAAAFAALAGDCSFAEAILLFGCAEGKNHKQMARVLAGPGKGQFKHVIVSTPGTFKPSDPAAVAESFKRTGARVELVPNPVLAWARVLELAGSARPVLVTGSFYMAAEIARMGG
ncbi:MAG: hypothetical protein B0D92_05390 [Spirochaeta sp. LUC14_002_19_P3]|nr:MAG: hypothetical protein B0D92_05390 [Spirochaeta sp. LUC14_002_19_P3]